MKLSKDKTILKISKADWEAIGRKTEWDKLPVKTANMQPLSNAKVLITEQRDAGPAICIEIGNYSSPPIPLSSIFPYNELRQMYQDGTLPKPAQVGQPQSPAATPAATPSI